MIKARLKFKNVTVDKKSLYERLTEGLRQEVQSEAPFGQRGSLKKDINVVIDDETSYVGYSSDTFWAYFVEYGHAIKRSRKGPVLGFVPPNPFMARAVEKFKRRIGHLARALKIKVGG